MKTLREQIAANGLDEKHEVAKLRQRMRYAMSRDRVKVFASTPLGSIPSLFFSQSRDNTAVDLGALVHAGNTDNTALYVQAWCRLNHIKG